MNNIEQKIPEGWSVKRLGQCFSFLRTSSYSRAETTDNGEVCYIHYGDIHTKYSLHVGPENIDIFVSRKQAQKADFLKTGDLIFLDASEDYEGTTRCIELDNITSNDKVISGLHTIALRDNAKNFSDGFRAYITSIPFVKNNFWKQVTGIKVYGISKDNLKKLKLLLPPLPEQEKIAEILGLWDDAIEKLSKLIEAKKLQKKGLMQKLLTGRHRLKGFSEPWKEVKLGDVCQITTGKLDANAMVERGKYKFFTCAKEVYLIDDYAFDTEALLISGNGANVGYIHYYNGKFNAYQRTYVLHGFIQNIFLVKYFLDQFLSVRIEREKKAGNTPYIVLDTLSKMKLNIPTDISEQKAIADILSAADEEIDVLNKKLEALKKQKQGLMQQLLTGKIRVKVN
jgi:type I restriction enzyme S subunit